MIEEKRYQIYLVTNLVTGKQYAGQTCAPIWKRWSDHKSAAKAGVDTYLYNSINFHGKENFVACTFRENLSKKEADEEEKLLIRTLRLWNSEFGYNMTFGGEGTIPTEDTRIKMIKNSPHRRWDISKEEVVSFYRAGETMDQIGRRFGVTRKAVLKRLREAGEPSRTKAEAQTLYRNLKIETQEIVEMYRKGMWDRQIATHFEISKSAVRCRLKSAGEPRRSLSEAKILQYANSVKGLTYKTAKAVTAAK
jgi:uncharacterized protein (DUF433 family)